MTVVVAIIKQLLNGKATADFYRFYLGTNDMYTTQEGCQINDTFINYGCMQLRCPLS